MAQVLVKHLMTTQVVTFFPEQTLPIAADVMHDHKFRHLPVVDESGRLLGLVTQRDILRAQISALTGLTDEQRRARQDHVRVSELMTRDIWTARPEMLASSAAQTLLDHRYSCLPVVDASGILVGILTERDFLKLAVKALRMHDDEIG